MPHDVPLKIRIARRQLPEESIDPDTFHPATFDQDARANALPAHLSMNSQSFP